MLQQILDALQNLSQEKKKTLVVFDLDSTLFDVSPRLERILLDFAALPFNQDKFPEEISLLKNAKTLRSDWGIQAALQRAGLSPQSVAFHTAVTEYWKKNFFSNHYLQFDRPYEGALEFVKAIDNLGAEIAYLTGRDVERMETGSVEVLEHWGFPLHEHATLVLKPHRSLDDAQFKTDWFIEKDKKNYEKIYFFENEPVNLLHLEQFCPHVEMIFFESTHAGRAAPPSHLPRIVNFLLKTKGS
ncbi:MAG: HAD family hydrolase [Bdellovibrio sp.]